MTKDEDEDDNVDASLGVVAERTRRKYIACRGGTLASVIHNSTTLVKYIATEPTSDQDHI